MTMSPERADARANRLRLIAAARELFRERGFEAEMKEIAERAGVGVGTIYRNFPTKVDLIVAIIGEVVSLIRATMAAAEQIEDPAAALEAMIAGGVAIVEEHGDLALVFMQDSNLPAACRMQFDVAAELAPIERVLRRGVASGVFRADLDAELTAAAIHASFIPWHYLRLRAGRDRATIAARLTALFLEGCRARPAADHR